MADIELIYKITLLSLLNKSKEPLSNEKITEFFQEFNYTDYFTVQKVINNLLDTDMIKGKSDHNMTTYKITSQGIDTQKLFKEKITPGIENDIKKFLRENGAEINEENSVKAIYDLTSSGDFLVHLAYEKDFIPIVNIELRVEKEEDAKSICNNWKERYLEMYFTIKGNLLE